MSPAEAFTRHFPISFPYCSLEFVAKGAGIAAEDGWGGCVVNDEGHLVATIRLFIWEDDGDDRSIRDVKEQQVTIVTAPYLDDPRLPAYFEGWAAAVRFASARLDEISAAQGFAAVSERLAAAMPDEFFCPEVLRLRRPQTADDFMDALLSNRKRLGWLLP
ncbi:hypothetical protein SAMN02745121_08459 [Nannocystis exedens]|uniref:Uncharacterized protein n=1 Tax=Nannocystis exedens TaxID=54 RepID=A0A1I2I5T5_9BACT|nr:hypothetical protein [Nannocystis exedens]PCC73561.1 hypothetical protein NAEX_06649 [Nannocystis exedens]SFF37544.1 hypothetical protein SAMN02745121_08459 [Nannocystis exedens]